MCIYILAIETSCDDTSASVIAYDKVLSNVIANQNIHENFGGIVPELASREHTKNIIPTIELALQKANINKNQLNAIAVTSGPGLLGSLMVGVSFAKAYAIGLNIPLIQVNHIHAHLLANFIKENDKELPEFPVLCLLVSGGHTQIVVMKTYLDYEIIGNTIDDAAGEAFDKAAKILGLQYPGGPNIEKYAINGNPYKYKLPYPNVAELDFSFSGTKTSFLYLIRDNLKNNPNFINENINDLAASFQHTVIDILIKKLCIASLNTGIKNIAVAGGVACNILLKERLNTEAKANNWKLNIPKPEFCTDNAAMIALTAYYSYMEGNFAKDNVKPYSRLK